MIVMKILASKLKMKNILLFNENTQARKLTTNQKVKVNFCLPEFRMTKIVTWEFHVDYSAEIRYGIILVEIN